MLHTLFLSLLIFSQTPTPPKTAIEVVNEQGSLFAVKFVPGQPIKFYIVGREEAELDLSKTKWAADLDPSSLSVNLRQTNPKPGKILKIKRLENHYIVDDPLALTNGTELHLRFQDKNKQDHSFKVKVKNLP